MADTALLVGSQPFNANVTIAGNARTVVGNFYLRHATAAISLLAKMVTEMGAAGVGSPAATMRQNLRVRLAGAANFTVTWNTTALRDALGFTGNLSGQSSYDAPNPSPLIWAPGYPATPRTRTSKAGYIVPHTTFHAADDGTTVETQHFGSELWQELEWRTLLAGRMSVADSADNGDTLEGLYESVLQFGYRLMYHQSVTTASSPTSELAWNDSTAFGPYQPRKPFDPDWYNRIIDNADVYAGPVKFELKRVEEYA